MTRVKICGLMEIDHAIAASTAGADFLGLVFAPSKRRVSPAKARRIVEAVKSLKPEQEVVGVFVKTPAKEVNHIAEYCMLDRVQFSGDETWQYCHKIELPFIKVIHVHGDTTEEDVITKLETGNKIQFDHEFVCILDSKSVNAYGGTGNTFDWRIAKKIAMKYPVIIAGGLTPSNVWQLVKTVKPWGVDVSSGVETNGIKSVEKIMTFINQVRLAQH